VLWLDPLCLVVVLLIPVSRGADAWCFLVFQEFLLSFKRFRVVEVR
jgi:hypothetical protein